MGFKRRLLTVGISGALLLVALWPYHEAILRAAASFPTSVKSFTTKTAGATINAAHVNDLQDEVTALEQDLINGMTRVRLGSSTLTLASDAVTATKSLHAVDTEAAAASDNLSTISAGSGVGAGHLLTLYAANVARVVTVKDSVGNLLLAGGDFALDSAKKSIALRYDGTNWVEIGRASTVAVPISVANGGTALTGTPTNGQLLIGNGTGYTLAPLVTGTGLTLTNGAGSITLTPTSIILDKSTTEQDVLNTVTETSVYSFSVTGGTLSTNKSLRLTLTGSHLNNSGGASTLNIQVKFGGTVVASQSALSPPASANRYPITLQTVLNANGTTNSQRADSVLYLGAAAATETTWTINTGTYQAMHSSLALDSTTSQTITVTITHQTAAATISFKRFAALLELLG